MWLALDTATDRASVAVGMPDAVAARVAVVGARRHAIELLPAIERLLATAGVTMAHMEGIVLADGPGSFTGLRVGAATAKALVHARPIPLWTVPSLLGLAFAAGAPAGALVLAVSDALRGELYAAAYRIRPGAVETVLAPAVLVPEQLRARVPAPEAVVGPAAAALGGWPTWPDAASLIGLVGTAGGAVRIADPAAWEPDYGRPAEAQARWERAHGRPLTDPSGARG